MEFFVVDAFENGPFTGNPAAIVPLDEWIPDESMQAIGTEFNLSETAFLVGGEGEYELRWFTPEVEVDLCGHATLATAHVLFNELETEAGAIEFSTRSGILSVTKEADLVRMWLPTAPLKPMATPTGLAGALGAEPVEVIKAHSAWIVVLSSEEEVRNLRPDSVALGTFEAEMFCVTAAALDHDFVVRVFAPAVGIDEDPATGSAQCVLAPYWGEKLGKSELRSFQAAARGAELRADWTPGEHKVLVSGTCRTFSRGEIQA